MTTARCTQYFLAGALMSIAMGVASAQTPPTYPDPYTAAGQTPQTMPPAAPAPANPIRNAFAATLSSVLQGALSAGTMGLSNLVVGGITDWFDRKRRPQAHFGTPYYPGTVPGAPTTTPGYPATYPQDPSAAGAAQTDPYAAPYPPATQDPYAVPQYPASQGYPAAPAYPDPQGYTSQTSAYGSGTQYYDAQTGQSLQPTADTYPYAYASGTDTSTLYAGIAYEVHALLPDGNSMPVSPATHEFRTGDRFMVHFRPSVPGIMEVYNINPAGLQTRIDVKEMAAGQLSSLGPYEFAAMKGDESLRLVLSPCSTPQLLTATRDIVNVSGASPAGGGVQLSSCGSPATRAVPNRAGKTDARVTTRDIRNIALDGSISFALDPVSTQEISSQQWASREVTIVFRHR